jgi:MSHA pilin protein MshD
VGSVSRASLARRSPGLTLIEVIIFIAVVSVALIGVLTVFNVSARFSADPLNGRQSLAIAEAMLDEILSKDFQNDPADPGNGSATLGCTPTTTPACRVNTPADRANYNDVDDFNGWSQATVYQIDGTLAPVLGSYSVAVTVTASTVSGVAGKQVAVSVAGGGESVVLYGFRASL